MADLMLSMDELQELYHDLRTASTAFGSIPRVTNALAHAVGHQAVETRVLELETSWDLRRAEIIASLDAIWRAAQAIHDNFDKLDHQVAAAINDQ